MLQQDSFEKLVYFKYVLMYLILLWYFQKQPSKVVLRKRCSENIQQIYRRTPMPLWHGCSPVNLLHILGTPFPKNTFERCSLIMNITITLAMQSTKITKGVKLKRFFSLLCNTSKNAWSLLKNFHPNRAFSISFIHTQALPTHFC